MGGSIPPYRTKLSFMIRKPRYTTRDLGKTLTKSRNKLKTKKGRENRKIADQKKLDVNKEQWKAHSKISKLKSRIKKSENPITQENLYDKIIESEKTFNTYKEKKFLKNLKSYEVKRPFTNEVIYTFPPVGDMEEELRDIFNNEIRGVEPTPTLLLVILEGSNATDVNAYNSNSYLYSEMVELVDSKTDLIEEAFFTISEKKSGNEFELDAVSLRAIWRKPMK